MIFSVPGEPKEDKSLKPLTLQDLQKIIHQRACHGSNLSKRFWPEEENFVEVVANTGVTLE